MSSVSQIRKRQEWIARNDPPEKPATQVTVPKEDKSSKTDRTPKEERKNE